MVPKVEAATSMCPPASAISESPDDLNATTFSFFTSTPAIFIGIAIPMWIWLPSTEATAMDNAVGSLRKRSMMSRPLLIGESALTLMNMFSLYSKPNGVKSL